MPRWQQCFERLAITALNPANITAELAGDSNGNDTMSQSQHSNASAPTANQSHHSDASAPADWAGSSLSSGEQGSPTFQVTVDGFQMSRPVVFDMTIHYGDAVWQIRRRYRQVWAVHTSLIEGLGHAAFRAGGLPRPPPRLTWRSCVAGQREQHFLEERAVLIQHYLDELLRFIPCVEQFEALYRFLCYSGVPRNDYGPMLGGQIIAGGAPPVNAAAVARLPRASISPSDSESPKSTPKKMCVVCQDTMDGENLDDDIRVLPCGHEFHFRCISQWLKQRNACCVCQGAAVLTAPRLVTNVG